jgi:hypothetical protein
VFYGIGFLFLMLFVKRIQIGGGGYFHLYHIVYYRCEPF